MANIVNACPEMMTDISIFELHERKSLKQINKLKFIEATCNFEWWKFTKL